MIARLPRALAAALVVLGTTAAGCGSGPTTPDDASPSSSGPASSPPASSPPASSPPTSSPPASSPAATKPTARSLGPCLLTTAAIGKAVEGDWRRGSHDGSGCGFASSRGGVLAVTKVEQRPGEDHGDLLLGLEAARDSCDTEPREVPRISAFACVERKDEGDFIVGNVVGGDHLWVVVIIGRPGGAHDAELDAMTAILRQLPPG